MNFGRQSLSIIFLTFIGFFCEKTNVLYAKTHKDSLYESISKNAIPKHIAIVMDGNGRWGLKHGKSRTYGHQCALKNVKDIVKECAKLKVEYLTFYGFSTENWKRDKSEVDFLMNLITITIETELEELIKNNVKVVFIGDISRLPKKCIAAIESVTERSKNNTGLYLTIALSYSSKWEIMQAIKKIIKDSKNGIITDDQVDENFIKNYLETKNIPDPDLFIRTSGENRLSNFLLHQLAYTELYFTPVLWPDFTIKNLHEAIFNYQNRDRRFGGMSTKKTK